MLLRPHFIVNAFILKSLIFFIFSGGKSIFLIDFSRIIK